MTCEHQSPRDPTTNNCAINRYGGKPHVIACVHCIKYGLNHENVQPPSIPKMLKTAGSAAVNFARSGFVATDAETLAMRETTCKSCDMWDSAAINGTGRCKKCGCATWAKLRMASERCPLGKW